MLPMLAFYDGAVRDLILLVYGALLVILAVRRFRARQLKERYALLLVFTGLPFVLLAVWPDALGNVAAAMGIEYQTLMVLCLAAFLILIILELLTIVSVQEQRIAALAQSVGILMEQGGARQRDTLAPTAATEPQDDPGETPSV